MKRSNNEIENEQLYISNQDTLTSLMAIQQQILNVDFFFKKKLFNIYGLLELALIGRDAQPYQPRLFYLFRFASIGSHSDYNNSGVSFS